MRVVDFHAHLTPDAYKQAIAETGSWHGLDGTPGELHNPGFVRSVEERIEEMDVLGVDVQVLSPSAGFYQYSLPVEQTRTIARECNDAVAEAVAAHPDRFAGMGILPMQDVPTAIAELERIRTGLGFTGAMISDHVGGRTYDDPEFLPFWEAAEALGALIFFHQGFDQRHRIGKYHLDNSVGNLTERALTFGVLVNGGVLDRFPRLKLLLAHAGGFVPFAVQRMDKAAGAFEEDARSVVPWRTRPSLEPTMDKAPSGYLGSFYYDCCTFSEPSLRFLIDTVGIDRIVLGTDHPAPMVLTNGVAWIRGLASLDDDEKEAILSRNPEALLAS